MERAAVIHSNNNSLLSIQTRDPHIGWDRKSFMCCSHAIHVIDVAIRGAATMKFTAIPRGIPHLSIAQAAGHDFIGYTKLGIGVCVACFGNRLFNRLSVLYFIVINFDSSAILEGIGIVIPTAGRQKKRDNNKIESIKFQFKQNLLIN